MLLQFLDSILVLLPDSLGVLLLGNSLPVPVVDVQNYRVDGGQELGQNLTLVLALCSLVKLLRGISNVYVHLVWVVIIAVRFYPLHHWPHALLQDLDVPVQY